MGKGYVSALAFLGGFQKVKPLLPCFSQLALHTNLSWMSIFGLLLILTSWLLPGLPHTPTWVQLLSNNFLHGVGHKRRTESATGTSEITLLHPFYATLELCSHASQHPGRRTLLLPISPAFHWAKNMVVKDPQIFPPDGCLQEAYKQRIMALAIHLLVPCN